MLRAKPLVFVGGHKENCQDLLANAAKRRAREQAGTCSAARTTSTTDQIEQGKGIPPRHRRHSSVGDFSKKEICPETVQERVGALASKFLDVWQGFSCRQR